MPLLIDLDKLGEIAAKYRLSPAQVLELNYDVMKHSKDKETIEAEAKTVSQVNQSECPHAHFESSINVGRLSETDGGPIKWFHADVKIRCRDCKKDFWFVGLPGGMSFTFPTVSVDAVECRMPIKPTE